VHCPKCAGTEMYFFSFGDVEIDRCPSCDGVWLDKDELDTVLARELGAQIDLVSFTQSPTPSAAAEAICHRCERPMVTLTGAADVAFEWCESCEGTFFDKGELSIVQAFRDD
jgi:MFS transporter, PAT family, beta-lactamase induction signal transducer AmpG